MHSPSHLHTQNRYTGFTLVELLVVIAIIAVLAALTFSVINRAILKGQQASCLNLMRNVEVGMESYLIEHNRPPLPREKIQGGHDTPFGDSGGKYSTAPIVAVLAGGEAMTWIEDTGDESDISYLNPNGVQYLELTLANKGEAGLREDGKIYDPWARELMIGVNARLNGDPLTTYGLAEWQEIKPRDQDFVMWSYGADGVKGKGESESFSGSDDVKSF